VKAEKESKDMTVEAHASEAVKVKRNGEILEVTLDRPKANAIDAVTSRALGEVFLAFRDDPGLRVAIITGGGSRFFSAGWDLKAALEGEAPDADFGPGGFAGLTELHDLDKPVIAAVNGLAIGGGFELALSADLIVAADSAAFALPEVKVGVIADAASFRLPKRLPKAVALEMLLTGRRMTAEEAQNWGLVNDVVSAESLMTRARALAMTVLEGAPLSIAAVKELVRQTENLDLPACYRLLRSGKLSSYEAMLASEDAKEGPRAFAEKRAPQWQGR
jgi:crotonobetainyl-CoA hydratase|tara:strand:- start:126 stop:953 length:828 start_codon:yes stop_codon:yes gene_type:complete